MKKINVLHLINSMDAGGAENLLRFQIPFYNFDKYNIHIGYLVGDGNLTTDIDKIPIKNFSNKGKFDFFAFLKLEDILKRIQ